MCVQFPLGRCRSDDSHSKIVVSNVWGFPVGVEDLDLAILHGFNLFGVFLALMGRGINSVEVA